MSEEIRKMIVSIKYEDGETVGATIDASKCTGNDRILAAGALLASVERDSNVGHGSLILRLAQIMGWTQIADALLNYGEG